LPEGIGGVATRDHDEPFQRSTSGEKVAFELILSIVTPTAQQERLLAHEDPSTMSSAVGLLLGAATIVQPDEEA
jgi:hypothetical protein